MKKVTRWIALIGGSVLSLIGIVFAGMYIKSAIIDCIGDGDQSLLFWYLPLLFIGIFLGGGGGFLLYWGIKAMREQMESDTQ